MAPRRLSSPIFAARDRAPAHAAAVSVAHLAAVLATLQSLQAVGPVHHSWSTPILEDRLDSPGPDLNTKLAALALRLEAEFPTEHKSNAGGWQSAPVTIDDYEPLQQLRDNLLTAAQWFVFEGL